MSKEIYREYVNKWIDADDILEQREVNDLYLFCGEPIRVNTKEDLLVISSGFDRVTRKPRTQMINEHEVVAPRYDEPTNKEEPMFILYALELCGFTDVFWYGLDTTKREAILKNGWFDNSDDAENYEKARRENEQ